MFRGKTVTVSCVFELKRFCFIVNGSAVGIVIYKSKNFLKAMNYCDDISGYSDVTILNHIDSFVKKEGILIL